MPEAGLSSQLTLRVLAVPFGTGDAGWDNSWGPAKPAANAPISSRTPSFNNGSRPASRGTTPTPQRVSPSPSQNNLRAAAAPATVKAAAPADDDWGKW